MNAYDHKLAFRAGMRAALAIAADRATADTRYQESFAGTAHKDPVRYAWASGAAASARKIVERITATLQLHGG